MTIISTLLGSTTVCFVVYMWLITCKQLVIQVRFQLAIVWNSILIRNKIQSMCFVYVRCSKAKLDFAKCTVQCLVTVNQWFFVREYSPNLFLSLLMLFYHSTCHFFRVFRSAVIFQKALFAGVSFGSVTLQQRYYRTATLPLQRNCYILCIRVRFKVVLSFNSYLIFFTPKPSVGCSFASCNCFWTAFLEL